MRARRSLAWPTRRACLNRTRNLTEIWMKCVSTSMYTRHFFPRYLNRDSCKNTSRNYYNSLHLWMSPSGWHMGRMGHRSLQRRDAWAVARDASALARPYDPRWCATRSPDPRPISADLRSHGLLPITTINGDLFRTSREARRALVR